MRSEIERATGAPAKTGVAGVTRRWAESDPGPEIATRTIARTASHAVAGRIRRFWRGETCMAHVLSRRLEERYRATTPPGGRTPMFN